MLQSKCHNIMNTLIMDHMLSKQIVKVKYQDIKNKDNVDHCHKNQSESLGSTFMITLSFCQKNKCYIARTTTGGIELLIFSRLAYLKLEILFRSSCIISQPLDYHVLM